MAQDWNNTALPWASSALPWNNTSLPWQNTSLPWKQGRGTGGAVSSDPEASALIARFSTPPDSTREGLIRDLVVALKTDAIWEKLDALYVLAAADSQAARLNWVADQYNLSVANSPTFTADRGYVGVVASSSYLDSGKALDSGGLSLAQDDNHMSVWVQAGVGSAQNYGEAGTQRLTIKARGTGDLYQTRNASAASNDDAMVAETGFLLTMRTASTGYAKYHNNTLVANVTQTSAAFDSNTFKVCAAHVGGLGALAPTERRIAAASFGASLTSAQVLAFAVALNVYLAGVGAI